MTFKSDEFGSCFSGQKESQRDWNIDILYTSMSLRLKFKKKLGVVFMMVNQKGIIANIQNLPK